MFGDDFGWAGVKKAVQEFAALHNREICQIWTPDCTHLLPFGRGLRTLTAQHAKGDLAAPFASQGQHFFFLCSTFSFV